MKKLYSWLPGLFGISLLALVCSSFLNSKTDNFCYQAIPIQDHLGSASTLSLNDYLLKLSDRYPGTVWEIVREAPGLLQEQHVKLITAQQYVNDLPLEGAELRIRLEDNQVFAALGRAYSVPEVAPMPTLWPEAKVKYMLKNQFDLTEFELTEKKVHYSVTDGKLAPAWTFSVRTKTGMPKVFRYTKHSLQDMGTPAACSEQHEEAPTNCPYRSGCTEHHGNVANYYHQAIVIQQAGKYKLIDNCERNIYTRFIYDGINYAENTINNWCSNTRRKQAYSAHWATRFAWDYFRDVMGRNGQFGDGRKLEVKLNSCVYAGTCNTAWSNPADFSINLGSDGLDYNQVKNLGHEYTHGVIWSSHWNPGWSNLPLSLWNNTETRSVTEGICNIMGSETENFLYELSVSAPNNTIPTNIGPQYEYWRKFDGSQHTWSGNNRSLYYKGTKWNAQGSSFNANNIYDRSFVLCHLFYLLAEGATNYKNPHHPAGSGAPQINLTPLNGNASRRDAAKLMYTSIMSYIHSDWTYEEMAWAMLTTASSWWGICSAQADRVNKALWAVGLAKSATEIEIDYENLEYNRPMTLLTPNNVRIKRFVNFSDTHIEAGKIIINSNLVHKYGDARVILRSKKCLPGSGVPTVAANYWQEPTVPKSLSSTTPDPIQVRVSPNPFRDHIRIDQFKLWEQADFYLHLIDSEGRLLHQQQYKADQDYIDLNMPLLTQLKAGTYFLRLQQGDQSVTKRVVKI